MDTTWFVAFLMVALAAILIVLLSRNLADGSERRLTRMMKRKGLDLETVLLDDPGLTEVIRDVRAHCRKCQHEDLCERWLKGEVEGENTFCPNARVFAQLSKKIKKPHPGLRFSIS